MADKPIVFVSCGQVAPAEKQLGQDICTLVREHTNFDPYFAEAVTSLDGLTQNIFEKLNRAVGFIFVLHARGDVTFGERKCVRASVWVEQELAIASFLRQAMQKRCFVAAYAQHGVSLEGVRKYILMNPVEFVGSDMVLDNLRCLLPSWRIDSREASASRVATTLENDWFEHHSAQGLSVLAANQMTGFMEVRCALEEMDLPLRTGGELQTAVLQSLYPQSGWPIGGLDVSGTHPLQAIRGGIVSSIVHPGETIDYSAMDSRGRLIFLRNYIESQRFTSTTIVGEARLLQTVEAVLFCLRLLLKLGAPSDAVTSFSIRHGGYQGFQYFRTYNTDVIFSNKVASGESKGAVQLPRDGFMVNGSGRLRIEPFISLTEDLFLGCDIHGLPEPDFFDRCIVRFLGR